MARSSGKSAMAEGCSPLAQPAKMLSSLLADCVTRVTQFSVSTLYQGMHTMSFARATQAWSSEVGYLWFFIVAKIGRLLVMLMVRRTHLFRWATMAHLQLAMNETTQTTHLQSAAGPSPTSVRPRAGEKELVPRSQNEIHQEETGFERTGFGEERRTPASSNKLDSSVLKKMRFWSRSLQSGYRQAVVGGRNVKTLLAKSPPKLPTNCPTCKSSDLIN